MTLFDPIENYLMDASFLLGNNSQQGPYPLAFSSNSCIDDFNYLNQSMATDIYTPTADIVYDGGLSCSSDVILGYPFLPTPTSTVCSLVSGTPSVEMELEDTCYFSRQHFPVPAQPVFGNNHQSQSFSMLPQPTFSVFSSGTETAIIQNQKPKPQPQPQQKQQQKQKQKRQPQPQLQPRPHPQPQSQKVDQKKFPCSHCNRLFARKYDAARHQRIHTGIKPYSCPCCNKGFSRSDARIRHFRGEFNCRDGPAKIQQTRHRNHLERGTTGTTNNACYI